MVSPQKNKMVSTLGDENVSFMVIIISQCVRIDLKHHIAHFNYIQFVNCLKGGADNIK